MSVWCSNCQDHYPVDHYGPDGDADEHLHGAEYGWIGALLGDNDEMVKLLEGWNRERGPSDLVYGTLSLLERVRGES